MEGKKISFGFMKTKKVEKLPMQEKKDFIECVEEKSIKVIGGDEVKEVAPLVIPMKPNTLITAERLKEIAEKVESALIEPETTAPLPKPQETAPENETLDQMAVRELLEESKKAVKVDNQQLTLSLPAKSLTSGEKESTLDDYESVPVQEFGLAMLRGMGWTKSNEKSTFKAPQLRPKGLGLGADKVVKDKQKVTKNSKDEELTIVKNAYVKITTGKYSGYYGKVLSLDEDNGRVMVDITVKKETVSLSEFMMHPVTKAEFDKESKVINANSFEQYKKNEGQKSSKNSDKESRSTERKDDEPKREQESSSKDNNNYKRNNEKQSENKDGKERSRDRSNREKYRDSSEERHNKSKSKKDRDSSLESLSDSDEKKHKKEKKSKKRYSSMESLDSDTDRRSRRREKSYDSETESEKRNKRRENEQKRYDSDSEDKQSRSKVKKRHDSVKRKKDKYKKNDSDSESERKSKKIESSKRYSSDSESDHKRNKRSDTPEGKRDIDKKRKGKKKKRDRDRSPNYRKHRK